jgi:hypothetical protein
VKARNGDDRGMRAFWVLGLALVVGCGDVPMGKMAPPVGTGGSSGAGAAGSGGTDAASGSAGVGATGGAFAGSGGSAGDSLPAGAGGNGAGTGGSLAGTGSGGSGGASTGTPCPEIASCSAEPDCAAALGTNCGGCSIGSYACGDRIGFFSSDGADFPCSKRGSANDCVEAINASSAKCLECSSSTSGAGGTAGTGGSSVGGSAGSAGAGGSPLWSFTFERSDSLIANDSSSATHRFEVANRTAGTTCWTGTVDVPHGATGEFTVPSTGLSACMRLGEEIGFSVSVNAGGVAYLTSPASTPQQTGWEVTALVVNVRENTWSATEGVSIVADWAMFGE